MYNKYMTKLKKKDNPNKIIITTIFCLICLFVYFMLGVRLVFIKKIFTDFDDIYIQGTTIKELFQNYLQINNNKAASYVNIGNIIYLLNDGKIYNFIKPDFIYKLNNSSNCSNFDDTNHKFQPTILGLLNIYYFTFLKLILIDRTDTTLLLFNPLILPVMIGLYFFYTLFQICKYLVNNPELWLFIKSLFIYPFWLITFPIVFFI